MYFVMEYLRIYESNSGGWVDLHPLHGQDKLPDNAEAPRVLADHGYRIQLLPSVPAAELATRQTLLPDVFANKNPDVRIDGKLIGDIKTPAVSTFVRKSVISRAIFDCAKQKVQIAIINLSNKNYSFREVKTGIVGALQPSRNKSINQVWIITARKNLFKIDRKVIFDDRLYDVLELL